MLFSGLLGKEFRMRYDDELQSLRKDLDELLNRAAGMKNRITAIEREIKLESIARGQDEVRPAEMKSPVEIPGDVKPVITDATPPPIPPPLPPISNVKDAAREPVEIASPTFASTHQEPVIPKVAARAAEPTTPPAGVEERIWKYWMPRVASVLLAIGVAWVLFLIAPNTTPGMRVAFGYGVAAVLLFAGWRLEKKYVQYARVLYGGGIGISYFVTFAAHYVKAARVIESEIVGIGALLVVVLLWGIVAQIRSSKIVATLVTLLGHLTIALTFFTLQDLSLLSVTGIAVLGMGSAFFLLANRWYYVAVVGLLGCYFNHGLWMIQRPLHFTQTEFSLSFGFLSLYMLTFALAELFAPEDLRRKLIPTRHRSLFVSTNTVLFFLLGTWSFYRYQPMLAHRDMVLAIYALVLGFIAMGYLRLRKGDPLYNAYLTKAVSVFTLALAVRYGQGTLTASLAIQSVVLLYSARRSGLLVTRILAFGIAILCVGQGFYTFADIGSVGTDDPLYLRRIVEAAFAIVGLFGAALLYQRTDWSLRSPATLPFSTQTLQMLWDLDFLSEPPKGREKLTKPLGGLQFPYYYAVGGMVLFVVYALMFAKTGYRNAPFAGFVLAATLLGFLLQSRPFSLVAVLGLFPVLISSFVSNVVEDSTPAWLAWISVAMVMAAGVIGDRRVIGAREGLAFHQMAASPYLLYCTTALTMATVLLARTETSLQGALLLAIAGVAAACLTLMLHARGLATATLILLGFATIGWSIHSDEYATTQWHVVALLSVGASLFIDRFFARKTNEGSLSVWGAIGLVFGWFLLMRYADALGKSEAWFSREGGNAPLGFGYFPDDWQPFAAAVIAFGYAGYAALTRSRTAVAVAGIGALFASLEIVTKSYERDLALSALVCGFVALALFWGICERLVVRIESPRLKAASDTLAGICVGIASVLLLIMVERIPSLATYFLTVGWGVLAIVLFGVSLFTHQRYYRYAGLGIFLLAILRLFKDAYELTGVYRPLAFIGLAVLMFVVSFGYFYAARMIGGEKEKPKTPAGPPPLKEDGDAPRGDT